MRQLWAWHISEMKVGSFHYFSAYVLDIYRKKKIIFKSRVHCEDEVPANFAVDRDYDWSQEYTED